MNVCFKKQTFKQLNNNESDSYVIQVWVRTLLVEKNFLFLGSKFMLFIESQYFRRFWLIFANFRRFWPIFGDFLQFSAKKEPIESQCYDQRLAKASIIVA
jgi:hypothetical protein